MRGKKPKERQRYVLRVNETLMTSKPDEVEKRKKLGIGERDD